jgi:hypothetical protein
MISIAMAITDLGESTVLLPTAVTAGACLWVGAQKRLAVLSMLALGGCCATMLILKLCFIACGQTVVPELSIHSPSGHSALSALFYGAVALLLNRLIPAERRPGALIPALGIGLAAAIGYSRIVISVHSPQEVALGLMVGYSWLALYAWRIAGIPEDRGLATMTTLPAVLLYSGLLLWAFNGQHGEVEGLIDQVAQIIHTQWGICAG